MHTKDNVIVTTSWDDGTITDLKLAELLEKYGIKGTFYIPKFMENQLPRKDIMAINKQFEIGAHSIDQPDLTKVSLAEAKRQIVDSKTHLEDLLGHNIPLFCYPFGRCNETIKRIVKDAGFIAARGCTPGGFDLLRDPYDLHITLFASNGSPLMALKICWGSRLRKISAFSDWEIRAKLLFDLVLKRGGVYHIYGHSEHIENANEWNKLERVFSYISNREGVNYMTNGEVVRIKGEKDKV